MKNDLSNYILNTKMDDEYTEKIVEKLQCILNNYNKRTNNKLNNDSHHEILWDYEEDSDKVNNDDINNSNKRSIKNHKEKLLSFKKKGQLSLRDLNENIKMITLLNDEQNRFKEEKIPFKKNELNSINKKSIEGKLEEEEESLLTINEKNNIIKNNNSHNVNHSVEMKKFMNIDKNLEEGESDSVSTTAVHSDLCDGKLYSENSSTALACIPHNNDNNNDNNNNNELKSDSKNFIRNDKKKFLYRDETLLNNDYQDEPDCDIPTKSTVIPTKSTFINNPNPLISEKERNLSQIIILKDSKDAPQYNKKNHQVNPNENYCIQLRNRKQQDRQLLEIKINGQIISEQNLNEFDTTEIILSQTIVIKKSIKEKKSFIKFILTFLEKMYSIDILMYEFYLFLADFLLENL